MALPQRTILFVSNSFSCNLQKPSDGNMGELLLETLTRRVRVLSIAQIADLLGDAAGDAAQALAAALEAKGFIERRAVLARPALRCSAPLVNWRPGDEPPEFGKVAYRLKSRWREPVEPIEIVQASRLAARRCGGALGGRWPRASETTHDVSLAEVFLWHQTHRPDDAACWVPEAQLYAEGWGLRGRLPDAVIRRGGKDVRIVEFGGSYGKQKLASFHSEMQSLPYEIW